MERSRAKETIASLFNNRFDKNNFTSFISNLLNSASFANQSLTQNNQIHDQFREHIESLERLTTYNDESDNEIDVLVVTLLKDTALDRARTMQRNFVARYLSNNNKDAALVAFVFPGSPDWRFSLISMESRFEGTRVIDEYTPAKRWSFLVGLNEGSHTAQRQLLEILANDSEDPSLENLIEAFNVETVSKEFYEKYRDLFDRMTENLKELVETDYAIEKDFRDKQIKPRDFARKTMGQIAFLYFLQKKGWFGVRPGEEWGTGVRNFVRKLFERRETYGNNFFNDILEPLFYEALALDRGSAAIYPKLNNVRMPFLNGGLFEPLNGYSWETTNIILSDELFSNDNRTKEGDQGDGILDIFDRYNFTVNESEPLEMEVAVDPEMLGKVFENLLPENIRKGKGAFYTPRPIVHYMCQESLINYLDTELGSSIEIKELVDFIRNESAQLDLTDELKKNANKIDKLLANIKVCDPAVGSGAFPLGLLNEIVTARVKIGEYIDSKYSIYDLKLHAISNSIYGVDLDPGAIEIAKLRFWLSLVVEEDTPSPLPNLDHKIMQGNSLISEYEGIKLFDDNLLDNHESWHAKIAKLEKSRDSKQKEHFLLYGKGEYSSNSKANLEEIIKPINREINSLKRKINEAGMLKQSSDLFDQEINANKQIAQNTARELNAKKAELISTHSQSEKERLKKKIEELTWRLIEITLQERGDPDKLVEIESLRRRRIKPFFIWKLEFSEVFKENKGFDVVIGNPPYGFRNVLTKEEKIHFREVECIEFSSGDSAELFCKKSFDSLVNDKGTLCFIIPKKSSFGDSWSGWRTEYLQKYNLQFILDAGKAFDNVLLEQTAFGISKRTQNFKVKLCSLDNKTQVINQFSKANKDEIFKENNTLQIYIKHFPDSITNKVFKYSSNEILVTGDLGLGIGTDFFSDEERKYKLLKGIDIGRWQVKTHRYLKNRSNLNWKNAEKLIRPKVIAQVLIAHIENPKPHIKITACYDREGIIITNTITAFNLDSSINPIFWMAYLNSSFVNWFAYNFIYSRAIRTMHLYSFYIEQIPVPIFNFTAQNKIVEIANQIMLITNSPDYDYKNPPIEQINFEFEIDQLVYQLYDLTEEEIEIIENSTAIGDYHC